MKHACCQPNKITKNFEFYQIQLNRENFQNTIKIREVPIIIQASGQNNPLSRISHLRQQKTHLFAYILTILFSSIHDAGRPAKYQLITKSNTIPQNRKRMFAKFLAYTFKINKEPSLEEEKAN